MLHHKILGLVLTLSTLFFCGCAKKFDPADPTLFYNIVYIALYSRSPGGQWYPVQGEYKAKFTQDTSGETTNGTYVMAYSSYLEPQFCAFNVNCVCSGGISGSFLDVTEEDQETVDTSEQPYNIFDPFDPTATETTAGTIDPATGLPSIEVIERFKFNIKIENSALSFGCKPEADKTIQLLRFKNGSVVMNNDYRDLYFVPLVLSK
jgi:hypothetical protein